MGEHNINSMFLTPVDESEIINIVKLSKPKNSKDCDDISMYVISKVIVSIAKPLAHIFNLSFSCGVFPDHMKIAKIIPISDVVKLKTAIIMFKAFHNLLPVNVQQLFSIYESAYTTRQNCHFKHYYSRTTLKGMCISITGVKLWNSLDNSLKNCRTSMLRFNHYVVRQEIA